jgi:hypothetical protein
MRSIPLAAQGRIGLDQAVGEYFDGLAPRGLQSQDDGLPGKTTGVLTAPEAVRANANRLALELLPHQGRLVGRILATAERPGTMLPFILALRRARS